VAEKYIIHGATFNGDGTSSAEAASNGAAGAWNNINIMTGTTPAYGSLGAGDTVTIRSKTAGGDDVAVAYSAGINFGSSAATAGSPITWVLDAGDVWSGINGTLTFSTSGNYAFWFRPNNRFISKTRLNWIVRNTLDGFLVNYGSAEGDLDGILIDLSQGNTGSEPGYMSASGVLRRGRIKFRLPCRYGVIFLNDSFAMRPRFFDQEFEQTASTGSGFKGIFLLNTYGSAVELVGGRLFGVGADSTTALVSHFNDAQFGTFFRSNGFKVPPAVPVFGDMSAVRRTAVDMAAADDKFGVFSSARWGYANSRVDGNFPYLNATLPDSGATGWSWQLLPVGATLLEPMSFPVAMKLYTADAAVLTLRLDLQVTNTYAPDLDTQNTWIEVSYVDASTGETRFFSGKASTAGAALPAGAAWSADYYGPISFVSKKLEVTTPSSVKKDTVILVKLCTVAASSGASEMILACPDVQTE
jgi:hypothetical protein